VKEVLASVINHGLKVGYSAQATLKHLTWKSEKQVFDKAKQYLRPGAPSFITYLWREAVGPLFVHFMATDHSSHTCIFLLLQLTLVLKVSATEQSVPEGASHHWLRRIDPLDFGNARESPPDGLDLHNYIALSIAALRVVQESFVPLNRALLHAYPPVIAWF
jgi:hypothetical protein